MNFLREKFEEGIPKLRTCSMNKQKIESEKIKDEQEAKLR